MIVNVVNVGVHVTMSQRCVEAIRNGEVRVYLLNLHSMNSKESTLWTARFFVLPYTLRTSFPCVALHSKDFTDSSSRKISRKTLRDPAVL